MWPPPTARRSRPQPPRASSACPPLELFFDLVFVLSFTQVTAKIADDPSWTGLGEGLLILAAVWWAWAGYSWLTNAIDPDESLNRIAIFVAMAAMLVVALAIPEAFGDLGLLFGGAYFVVRVIQLHLYISNTRRAGDDSNLAGILRLAPGFLLGALLLVIAGALDGGARTSLWIIAILIDWSTPLLFGSEDFHLHPGHFAERHGLIVIIALGESIVAIGAGAGFELETAEVIAAVLAIAAVAALWWAYFDIVAIVAERRLTEAPPAEQAPLARDSYSYIHFPMIAGIVLLAVGLKKTELAVGNSKWAAIESSSEWTAQPSLPTRISGPPACPRSAGLRGPAASLVHEQVGRPVQPRPPRRLDQAEPVRRVDAGASLGVERSADQPQGARSPVQRGDDVLHHRIEHGPRHRVVHVDVRDVVWDLVGGHVRPHDFDGARTISASPPLDVALGDLA